MSSARAKALQTSLRRALAAAAKPADAPAMQAYMKSAMPFYGVHAPAVRAIAKKIGGDVAFEDAAAWSSAVLRIFREARFREERYAAIALTGLPSARPFQTLDALALYEALIVEGAWWDLVDELAAHRVGALLATHGAPMKRAMRAWAKCDDLWKRRTAILSQLRLGAKTDRALLFACIEPSIGSKEFFLRKAIGWALRQYARVEPDVVAAYVRDHEAELSGLSKREALRGVTRAKGS